MSTGTNEQMITGGELVAKALKAEGVEVIYTLCGGHIIDTLSRTRVLLFYKTTGETGGAKT